MRECFVMVVELAMGMLLNIAGYPASLGFPIMFQRHVIFTHSVIAITYNNVLHLPNKTYRVYCHL